MSAAPTQLSGPYLIFLGDVVEYTIAKTGAGIAEWCPELCLGQYRFPETKISLGLTDLTPAEAAAKGAKSLIIGVATVGGEIPDHWMQGLFDAIDAGLDIVAGLHCRLNDNVELRAAAEKKGVRLVDVRVPPSKLPVGTGEKRSGLRVLTIGTDCAVGKKYTALAVAREMRSRGLKADFRASGQTGIMIAGEGIPIDAVVSDFLSGAAELLSPDNDKDHWDVIEGQGSLFHPGYASVTLGLLHGSQPDAFIVCHEANRTVMHGWPDYGLPSIQDVIDRTIELGVSQIRQ
jgi:uncharacterized NAD-dependent epimerase/dehydratase family protein